VVNRSIIETCSESARRLLLTAVFWADASAFTRHRYSSPTVADSLFAVCALGRPIESDNFPRILPAAEGLSLRQSGSLFSAVKSLFFVALVPVRHLMSLL
jgi:hypothetical protein